MSNNTTYYERFPGLFDPKYPEAYIVSHPSGWDTIVEEALVELAKIPGLKVTQIKEKFGGLRIYTYLNDYPNYSSSNDFKQAYNIVRKASTKADETCQLCGVTPAKVRESAKGWLYNACESCYQQQGGEPVTRGR